MHSNFELVTLISSNKISAKLFRVKKGILVWETEVFIAIGQTSSSTKNHPVYKCVNIVLNLKKVGK